MGHGPAALARLVPAGPQKCCPIVDGVLGSCVTPITIAEQYAAPMHLVYIARYV